MVLMGHDEGGVTSYTGYATDYLRFGWEVDTMTGSIERGATAGPRQTGYTPLSRAKNGFAELDMPSFISQILAEYQDILVHQVERDVKSNALAAVKEEAHLLHSEAEERLRSMESDVQRRAQAVLGRAQESIFDMLREEMEDIFIELDARLQCLLDNADVSESAQQGAEEQEKQLDIPGEKDAVLERPRPLEVQTVVEASEQEACQQEVRLELLPPLDLRHLLGFYRGLSKTKDVRILRALGSLDKGVSLYIRPKEPASVTQLLRTIPGVQDVSEGTSRADVDMGNNQGANTGLNLRILLTVTGG